MRESFGEEKIFLVWPDQVIFRLINQNQNHLHYQRVA